MDTGFNSPSSEKRRTKQVSVAKWDGNFKAFSPCETGSGFMKLDTFSFFHRTASGLESS